MSSTGKRKFVELDMEKKNELVTKLKAIGWSFDRDSVANKKLPLVKQAVRSAAREYGIHARTVTRIMERAREAGAEHNKEVPDVKLIAYNKNNYRRLRGAEYPLLEKKLMEWVNVLRAQRAIVDRATILTNAEILGKVMSVREDFQFSNGWFSNFAKRYGLRSKALHGQAGDVTMDLEFEKQMIPIREFLSDFHLDNIYNMDETGLFYKCLPNRTYVAPNENGRMLRGTKAMKAKDRVTLITCTNASGNDKVPLMVIGQSKEPRCFKGEETLPLPYHHQKNSWNDSVLQEYWFKNVFLKHIRKRTKEKVVLLMNNFGTHDDVTERDGVIYKLLPKNSTSAYHPMDAGVIYALKLGYKRQLLRKTIENMEDPERYKALRTEGAKRTEGTRGINFGYAANLLDVMHMCKKAWDNLSTDKIHSFWLKSTCLPTRIAPNVNTKIVLTKKEHEERANDLHDLTELVTNMTIKTTNSETESHKDSMDIYEGTSGGDSTAQVSWDKFVEAWMDIECDADILSATASDVLFGEELIQNIYREPKETENADCMGNTENAETQGTTSMGEIEPGLAQTDCYTFESQSHDQDSVSDAERLAEVQSYPLNDATKWIEDGMKYARYFSERGHIRVLELRRELRRLQREHDKLAQ